MPITCDDCGKEATYTGMPEGGHWFRWMSDPSRAKDSVVCVPCGDGVISCVCMDCLQATIDEMTETVGASAKSPNEETSGN